MATYPATLPNPNKSNYQINPQSGVVKTQMTSGYSRQRQITTNPPTQIPVTWSFSKDEYGVFESWYLHKAKMGAAWFDVDLLSGQGFTSHSARFMNEGYSASLNANTNKVDVTATLEVVDRPTLSEGALDLLLIYGTADLEAATADIVNCTAYVFNQV